MTLPASWSALLEPFRPVFRRRGTFTLFTVLATGLVLQTGRRSVVGMLAGAGMASKISFHAACRFFSSAVWDVDALCLIAARLIVTRLLEADAPIVVAVDDTLFKRWGKKVHHAFWTHDGSAQGGKKIARGNRWIIAGIVVRLPFVTAPLCLPVLFRLWAGKGTRTPVELAGELLNLLAAQFPGRMVHGVGDAAYHGKPLLVTGTTWTTRLPANAALYDLARRPPAGAAAPPQGRQARQARGPGRDRVLAAGQGAALWPHRHHPDRDRGLHLVRQLRQRARPVRAGPRRGLSQTLRPGLVHPRPRSQPCAGHGTLRGPLVDRTVERGRQTADRRRAGPQPGEERGRADRPVRDAHPIHRDRLVRPARLPPRRHHRPPAGPALVRHQDRAVLRGHAHQAPPHPDRHPIYRRSTRSRLSHSSPPVRVNLQSASGIWVDVRIGKLDHERYVPDVRLDKADREVVRQPRSAKPRSIVRLRPGLRRG